MREIVPASLHKVNDKKPLWPIFLVSVDLFEP